MNARAFALLTTLLCLESWVPSAAAEGLPIPHVELASGFALGNATELVLRDGTYDDPVSRLQWPVPPSLTLSLTATVPWAPWTSSLASLEGLAPLAVGTLVDEDWNADTLVYGHSSHSSYLTAHWSMRAEQSFSWEGWSASLGGLYRWMQWEGWNGQGTYLLTSGLTETETFSGLIIMYRQQWFIPYVGASYTFDVAPFELTPSLRFSPYTWCLDMDNHKYARTDAQVYDDYDFLDRTRGGLFLQGALDAAFIDEAHTAWGLRLGGELAWGSVGDTITTYSYQSSNGATAAYSTAANAAGAWFWEASLTAFMRN